jgi:hypothetical protein
LENQGFPVKTEGVPDHRRSSIIVLDNANSLSVAWQRVKSVYNVQAPMKKIITGSRDIAAPLNNIRTNV